MDPSSTSVGIVQIGMSTYLLILLLLALSAFFSASETAFSTVNTLRIRNMAEDGNERARTAVKILDSFDRMLSTILIGNNLVNIALSAEITVLATALFGSAGVAIATGIATLLVLNFGEIMPKSFAKEYSERLVLAVAPVLRICIFLLYPFSSFFIWLRGLFLKERAGEDAKAPTITEKELIYMLDAIEEEGVLEEQEKDLVQSALEFDETTVQEILTPRVSLFALDVDEDPADILREVTEEKYSRVPVYQDTIDNIIGIVQSRAILERAVSGQEICLRELMTDVMFVHRTMKISKLLTDFQRGKTHMAVVIDDYGGTLGIVTMEDLLEELVGDIWDEDEEVVNALEKLPDGRYAVSGDMGIYEFFDEMDYSPKGFESNYNTMNGWALEMLEHIPQVGEHFTYDRFTFTVEEMNDQKIVRLIVEERLADIPEDGKEEK